MNQGYLRGILGYLRGSEGDLRGVLGVSLGILGVVPVTSDTPRPLTLKPVRLFYVLNTYWSESTLSS